MTPTQEALLRAFCDHLPHLELIPLTDEQREFIDRLTAQHPDVQDKNTGKEKQDEN